MHAHVVNEFSGRFNFSKMVNYHRNWPKLNPSKNHSLHSNGTKQYHITKTNYILISVCWILHVHESLTYSKTLLEPCLASFVES